MSKDTGAGLRFRFRRTSASTALSFQRSTNAFTQPELLKPVDLSYLGAEAASLLQACVLVASEQPDCYISMRKYILKGTKKIKLQIHS